jgi:S-adenosylmethionine:tRNA ribosyltransferase-isomerase
MSARLSDYDYDLPRELIAQRPAERRDASRMMVLKRATQTIEHRQFCELKTFLQQGDLLVLNDTRVLSARRFSDDGAIEFLFLERLSPRRWRCLITPGRKMRVGATTTIDGVTLCVEEITPDGERVVVLNADTDLYSGRCLLISDEIMTPMMRRATKPFSRIYLVRSQRQRQVFTLPRRS